MADRYPLPFTPLEEYAPRFKRIAFERSEDGILKVQLHRDGGPFSWSLATHRELSSVWNYIGMDPENKIIILTGTGASFLTQSDYETDTLANADQMDWLLIQQDGKKLLTDLLEIEQPIIAALNGPVHIHSQIPMLCDIVIATENTTIQETHFPYVVPGDGHHIIWPALLGLNRANYMLLMNKGMTAQQALDWGVIGEIVPSATLMSRAYEIARELLQHDPLALRQFRMLAMQPMKRLVQENLTMGLLAEGYGIVRRLAEAKPLGVDPRTTGA